MELNGIVGRFVEGLLHLDATDNSPRFNKKGERYLAGVKSMPERYVTTQIGDWWKATNPQDFPSPTALKTEVPYLHSPKQSCDYVISTDSHVDPMPEWAIEVKHLSFIGDNGKRNDYAVQKLLSPYRKDGSLIHDIDRLAAEPIAMRKAVLGYAFRYSFQTCEEADQLHPSEARRINEIRKVCRANDPAEGNIDPLDMVHWADEQFSTLGKVKELTVFEQGGLWRHPCGGYMVLFAWELP